MTDDSLYIDFIGDDENHILGEIGPSIYTEKQLELHRRIARSPLLVGYEREYAVSVCGLRVSPAFACPWPVRRIPELVKCSECLAWLERFQMQLLIHPRQSQ